MNLIINKMAYNVLEGFPEKEEIFVDLIAKFGASKENFQNRAFFLEVNINCKSEDDSNTRNFSIMARFDYQLENDITNIGKEEVEEDHKFFIELLKRINKVIINVTSQDDVRRPLDINKAIDDYDNPSL